MKNYVSSKAKCPFYRSETPMSVACEGIKERTYITLTLEKRTVTHIDDYCKSDSWRKCPIAAMLLRINGD